MTIGPPAENGCYLLFLQDGHKVVGEVHIEETAGIRRLEVNVPASKDQRSFLAILAPVSVLQYAPCTAEEAGLIAASLRRDLPHAIPDYSHEDIRASGPLPQF